MDEELALFRQRYTASERDLFDQMERVRRHQGGFEWPDLEPLALTLKTMASLHRGIVGLERSRYFTEVPSFVRALLELREIFREPQVFMTTFLAMHEKLIRKPFPVRFMLPRLQSLANHAFHTMDITAKVEVKHHLASEVTDVLEAVWCDVHMGLGADHPIQVRFNTLVQHRGVVEAFINDGVLDTRMYRALNALHDFFSIWTESAYIRRKLLHHWNKGLPRHMTQCRMMVRMLYIPGGGEPVRWPMARSLTMQRLKLGGLAISCLRRRFRLPVDVVRWIATRILGEDVLMLRMFDNVYQNAIVDLSDV